MSKIVYKVGDKVERVSWGNNNTQHIGDIFSIIEVTAKWCRISEYNMSWTYKYINKHFKLLPNKNLIGGRML